MNPRSLAALCLACVCAGCMTVGPDYQTPDLAAPAAYSETASAPRDNGQAAALELAAWWRNFGDPQLASLMERAAKANLDLEQARARIAQARAALRSSRASFWPSSSLSGSATRSKESQNAVAGASYSSGATSSLYQAGFDASWELDVFGGVRRSVESAEASLEASQEDLSASLLTLLGEVATNYVDLRSAQSRLAIARTNLEAQAETVEVTRARYNAGLVSLLDVAQAEAQQADTAADIPGLEATAKQAMHRLGILLGQAPGALKAELSEPRPQPKPEQSLPRTGLPSDLLSRRPDLRRAERQLAAASADIGVATAGLYPSFDLTLGLGLQSTGDKTFLSSASRYWSIAPGINLPLFSGGATLADIESKRALYDEALAAYRAAFLSALEDVENALAGSYAQQARLALLARSVQANEQTLALARERYARGLTNFLDVLTAQTSLYTAQDSLDQCRADLLTQIISLCKALGGGLEPFAEAPPGLAAGFAGSQKGGDGQTGAPR